MSKTGVPHWFDLFHTRGTRRDFLRVGASAASLIALGSLPGCGRGRRVPGVVADPFTLGVASGDPTPDGLVLWARPMVSALREPEAALVPLEVRWEVAEDEGFRRVVRTGISDALPELGHSVHAEVAGLRPARDYFYRWIIGGESSPTGRTKTAPNPDSANTTFDFAFASCQHYEQGYYTALRHLSEEPIDLVVHLGDYIYEGAAVEGRARIHEGPEVVTLDQYRARYTTYRSDPDLQAAHAAAPWVATTDDHEVDNNWAGIHPEDDQSPEAFLLRRAAAYQAFYEFLPMRAASMPSGPDALLYRRLRFGTLVDMRVLDTRQYRSDQPCDEVIGPSCAQHMDPDRTMLGQRQRAWLVDGLAESDARWNVLAQQVLMARFRDHRDGEETWSMDKWDGYPVERASLLDAIGDSGVPNPIILTGDIHSSWVTRLKRDFDDAGTEAVATEFACTSLSSGGNGSPMTGWGEAALRNNAHVDFYDARRGYVVVNVTPQRWRARYRIVPEVESPGGSVETIANFVVDDGAPGAERG